MISEEYKQYLQSDKWKGLRQKVLDRDNHKCRICGNTNGLDVHHITGQNRFNESPADLMTLCRKCHDIIHTYFRQKDTQEHHYALEKYKDTRPVYKG